jgi:hypothetical protein
MAYSCTKSDAINLGLLLYVMHSWLVFFFKKKSMHGGGTVAPTGLPRVRTLLQTATWEGGSAAQPVEGDF